MVPERRHVEAAARHERRGQRHRVEPRALVVQVVEPLLKVLAVYALVVCLFVVCFVCVFRVLFCGAGVSVRRFVDGKGWTVSPNPHPNHTQGLLLLGDSYSNHLRDLEAAEACYRKILAVEPNNVQGLHNLCVVMVERGDLLGARTCLADAHRLAPHEDYVKKHLEIVEAKIQETMAERQKQQQQQQLGPETGEKR